MGSGVQASLGGIMRVVVEGRISATRPVMEDPIAPRLIPTRGHLIADGDSYVISEDYERLVLPVPHQLQHRVGDRVRVTFEIEEEPRVPDPDPELIMRAE